MKRFLITTSEESTWKFDQPVIFLGEWCKRHDQEDVWKNMDYMVAEPYGLKQGDREKSFEEIKSIVLDLLPDLTISLNNIHNVTFSERYWNMLVGHWLLRCVMVIFNRYNSLIQAIENNEINENMLICI